MVHLADDGYLNGELEPMKTRSQVVHGTTPAAMGSGGQGRVEERRAQRFWPRTAMA